ncbi:MAG: MFS transporter [Myxococcota bacterium]
MPEWFGQTFAALSLRHFRILWLGSFSSFLGFFMSTVVNSVVAFDLAGTNRAVGTVVFGQALSMFLLTPLGGAYADRWPKRRVIAIGQGITSAIFVLTAWLLAEGMLALWHLAAGGFGMGACFAFIGPARQALVVDVVPEERRGNAVALSQIANSASRIGGPALAGLFLAWPAVGAAGAYLAMAACYAVAALMLIGLPKSRRRTGEIGSVWTDIAEGVRYVHADRHLRLLMWMFVLVIMAGFPYVTVMPGLVENALGREAEAIGWLMGSSAVGGLLTSIAVARFADSEQARALYSSFGMGFGLSLIALAFVPSYAVAMAGAFALGVCSGGFQTLNSAVLIRATAPVYMGRVMALSMMAFAGFGLVGLPIGWLADAIGERGTLAVMGVGVTIIVAFSWAALVRVARDAAAAPNTA